MFIEYACRIGNYRVCYNISSFFVSLYEIAYRSDTLAEPKYYSVPIDIYERLI